MNRQEPTTEAPENQIDLAALEYHLFYNHHPRPPIQFLDFALQAIEAARADDWDARIDGSSFINGTFTTARQMVEAFHLDFFVDGGAV